MAHFYTTVAALMFMAGLGSLAHGQERPDPAKLIAAQQQAMTKLAMLDGNWRGPASILLPSGEKLAVTQTERVGPFLDGSVRVIEGRGYDAAGKVVFNAFGTIGYNPATNVYTLHARAMGNVGEYVVTPQPEGFIWEIPAGPMTIRYMITIKDGTWNEVGDRIVPGKAPIRFHEMSLKRLGDTNWPAGDPVPFK